MEYVYNYFCTIVMCYNAEDDSDVDVLKTMHHDIFLLKKNQREALISQIYFWNRTLHVSDSISVQNM